MPQNGQESITISKILLATLVLFLLGVYFFYKSFISPPDTFPIFRYLEIENGWSIDEAGNFLKEKGVIRSPFIFRILIGLTGVTGNVIAGEFRFEEPVNVLTVVESLSDTSYKGRAIKVTVPEGFSNKDIADLLDGKLPNFDRVNFMKVALSKEGSLFPDTYIFPITYNEEKVVNKMFDNFQTKIVDIKPAIIASKRTRAEIIIMASILEKEARTTVTREMISGILWKRLDKGMPLQVDASFAYLLNKASSEITLDDLKIDSPYNTYKYRGLPPGAISNPGLDALTTALYSTESKYLYYLSDKDGNMHYAVTFEEHKKNKVLHLP